MNIGLVFVHLIVISSRIILKALLPGDMNTEYYTYCCLKATN